jgi:CBS domain-containing protein
MDYKYWLDYIKNVPVSELLVAKQRPLIVIQSHFTLSQTIQVLSRENILSAPIISGERIDGMVDVIDITGFILMKWKENSRIYSTTSFPSEEIFDAPILDVLNFSRFDPVFTIFENQTVYELIQIFRAPRTFNRLHRVLVMGEDGNVRNVVSQSDLIVFAAQNISMIDNELLNKTLPEINAIHTVICVRIDSSLIDVLDILYTNKISGMALVDENYHLVGNFSCSDLRGIHFRSFEYFLGSIIQFQSKGTLTESRRTVSIPSTATLGEAILDLNQNGVHRLYVNDQFNRPVGVVSLSDVISHLV